MAIKLKLNRRSNIDLSEQLYHSLKQLILDGALTAGERIPSSRELSAQLKISRPTVAVCLEQLQQEGFVELKHGSGTFVSTQVRVKGKEAYTAGRKGMRKGETKSATLSTYAKSIQNERGDGGKTGQEKEPEIAFYCWRAALDQFPQEQWARILGRHARLSTADMQNEPLDPRGEKALRAAIADLVLRFRGLKCTEEQVLVVNGLNQAIDLVARLHLDPGTSAMVEEPGYHQARLTFAAMGAKIHPAPVDEEGLDTDVLLGTKTAPRLVYITPSHQFPTGHTMSLKRRLKLLDWASRHQTIILEDDYDSEYQRTGKPIPALMSLDKGDSVIYAGTLNQLMYPSLGFAYLIVPPPLVPIYSQAKLYSGAPLPPHLQNAIAQFIEEGHLERHIKRLRNLYDERREVLLQALKTHFGNRVYVSGDDSGVFVLVRFQTKLSTEEFVQRASKYGVGLTATTTFYSGRSKKNEYILGFGSLNARQIKEGVRRLASILKAEQTSKH